MLREMRPSELGMWRALYAVDPWGEDRADLRQALTTRAVAQAFLKKESGDSFTLQDFMPMMDGSTVRPTLAARLRTFLKGLPGKA